MKRNAWPFVAVTLAGSLVFTPLSADAQQKAGIAREAALQNPANPILGAKQLILHMHRLKNIEELPENFTNRSAAVLAFPFILVASFTIAAADPGLLSGDGKQKTPTSPKAKAMQDELEGIFKRYGISDMDKELNDDQRKSFEMHGRQITTELLAFMHKYEGKKTSKQKKAEGMGNTLGGPEDFNFTRVSPTVVRISMKNGKPISGFKKKKDMEAHFEDGRWRLDFGGMEALSEMSGMSGPGSKPQIPPK